MPYLIDGHNLIGQMPDISLSDPNDEAKLVQRLIGFVARTRKRCVVVFDGGVPGGYSPMSTYSVTVIFAAAQQSNADRLIMERMRNERDAANWTVVSSDHDVLNAAKNRGMKPMRSGAFVRLLNRPSVAKSNVGENPNVVVPPDEVAEWLKIFGVDEEE